MIGWLWVSPWYRPDHDIGRNSAYGAKFRTGLLRLGKKRIPQPNESVAEPVCGLEKPDFIWVRERGPEELHRVCRRLCRHDRRRLDHGIHGLP